MGQSAVFSVRDGRIDDRQSVAEPLPQLSIFPTNLGWFGLLGANRRILGLLIGHISASEVREAVRQRFTNGHNAAENTEADWFPSLRLRLERYACGEKVDFDDCHVELPSMTAFQQRVVEATRKIGFGQTLTYGQLADKAGSPAAARAVGNVMASNRVPIIIPCHRVVASGGKWGGFSAPQGLSLKRQMLEMEAEIA